MKIIGVDSAGTTTTFRLRRLDAAGIAEATAAVERARADGAAGPVYRLPRGYSTAMRAVARVVVGVGVVAMGLVAVAAFLSPDNAAVLMAAAFVPVSTLVLSTLAVSYWFDAGVAIAADGRLRREGWGGVTDANLRDFVEVRVVEGDQTAVVS